MIVFLILALVAGIVFYALIFAKGPQKGQTRGRSGGHGGSYRQPAAVSDVPGRWSVIMASAEAGAAGLKNAVTEADKLFDAVLAGQGLRGDTMADRLKGARTRFSSYSVYDGIWRAHKLRNAIAHEVGFDLVQSQAREALHDFERGLKDLGAL